ncbi:MAG: MlaD family protein [Ghiorsea sp.]
MTDHIAHVKESTKLHFFTSIWLVPILALLIAMWLTFAYYAAIGPQIRIHFETNEGLKVGQSQIKYKDIPIGKITDIQIPENTNGIIVIVNIDSKYTDLIKEGSQFWIVKPEVSMLGISGLNTLLSGTYIDMYKGDGKKEIYEFRGLAYPYKEASSGSNYILTATEKYGLSAGSPIYYKNIEIGQVEKTQISPNGELVHFIVSIGKQYTSFVHTDSKFWLKSTASIGLNHGTLDINVAPLSALIRGGVILSSSTDHTQNIAAPDSSFELSANEKAAQTYKLGQGHVFVETFEIDTSAPTINLAINAEVKFKGYQVGTVKRITPYFDGSIRQLKSKVLLDIDLSSFTSPSTPEAGKAAFYSAVKSGLRTKIIASDPILANLSVDLFFDNNPTKQSILEDGSYPVLPTIYVPSATIKEVLTNLNQLLANIDTMSAKDSFKNLPDELTTTMKALTQTLHAVDQVVGGEGNSALSAQITQALRNVSKTSKEMQRFLDKLNEKPDMLIFGD